MPPTTAEETPVASYNQLLTGYFRVRRHYHTWRPHGAADWLMIYTVAGAGHFRLPNGEQFVTAPGDNVLLAPGALHDYGLNNSPGGKTSRWNLLWAHFLPRAEWEPALRAWPAEAPGLFRLRLGSAGVPLRRRIERRLVEMHRLAIGAAPRALDLAFNALEEVLWRCDECNPSSFHSPQRDERITRAAEILCQNLAHSLRLTTVARHVGLSPSRLTHLFTAQFGRPPSCFLEEQRLGRARQLLTSTQRPIGEIAQEVGFENPFYFSRRFRRHTGLSPRDYRHQHGR